VSIILGIDPGSNVTGYGVINSEGNQHRYLDCGVIRVKPTNFASQLQQIFSGIRKIVELYQPEEVAVEQVFVHVNVNSALKLGQARGAAIVAAALNEQVKFAEYSSRQVKQAVVGYGAATKAQVQHMIKALLQLSEEPVEDAADALAVALCHAQTRRGLALIKKAERK
jgi:crossover junction endodeoxyribonuclease RuvC